jgi:NAD(P)-dependent dehydrogenase (short-subunit alcohol dehydrogenase family)
MLMFFLKGKVALVTGGSRDIGVEIVKTLTIQETDVAITYRSAGI